MSDEKTKFKVGDLVKLTDIQSICRFAPDLKIGDVGTISAIRGHHNGAEYYDVTFPKVYNGYKIWSFGGLELAHAKKETLLDVLKKADYIELDRGFINRFELNDNSESDDYLLYSDSRNKPFFTKQELLDATQNPLIPNQWEIIHTESGKVFYLIAYKLVLI